MASLAPGQSIFFRPKTRLVALAPPRRFTITVEIEWTTADKKVRRQAISLGPVQITRATEPRLFAMTKTYVALLRDLAIPIGLLLITWLFSANQRNAEADRASLNLMLPKSHQDTERYYAPVGTAARNVAGQAEKVNPADADSFDELTYWLLLYRKRTRTLFEKIGGYYLPTRLAEQIVVVVQNLFSARLRVHVDPVVLGSAKDQVNIHTEYYVYRRKALHHCDVREVRAGLVDWATKDPDGFERAVALLLILEEVLLHDVNLIYEFWYEDRPEERPELTKQVELLRSGDAEMQKIAKEYLRYRETMRARPW